MIIRPAACSCGMPPLDPAHLAAAAAAPVCAERVADVRQLAELRRRGEDGPAAFAPGPSHRSCSYRGRRQAS